jgi:hypothetical protein
VLLSAVHKFIEVVAFDATMTKRKPMQKNNNVRTWTCTGGHADACSVRNKTVPGVQGSKSAHRGAYEAAASVLSMLVAESNTTMRRWIVVIISQNRPLLP